MQPIRVVKCNCEKFEMAHAKLELIGSELNKQLQVLQLFLSECFAATSVHKIRVQPTVSFNVQSFTVTFVASFPANRVHCEKCCICFHSVDVVHCECPRGALSNK